jgi:hypothetical protein
MDERAKKHHLSAVSSRFCRDTACLIIPMPAIAGFWSTLRASGQSTYPTSLPHGLAPPRRTGCVATVQSLPCVSTLCFAADDTRTRRDVMTTCVEQHLRIIRPLERFTISTSLRI